MGYDNWSTFPQFWTGLPTYDNPRGGLPPDLQNFAPSHINWDKPDPELGGLPTYGNYGGPGYTAGHFDSEGIPRDPKIPGVDALDNLFKAHDIAYIDAEGSPDKAALIDTADNSGDIDTLYLKDVMPGEVKFSYQGNTLLISITSTGEVITVPDFLDGVTSLLTGAGADDFGIDAIVFADGSTMNRQQITYRAGEDYLGRDPVTYTLSIGSSIAWSYFVDEFGMGSSPEETDREIEVVPNSDKSTIKKFVLTEKPHHEVAINLAFALAKFPVSKDEFAAFGNATSGPFSSVQNYREYASCRQMLPDTGH